MSKQVNILIPSGRNSRFVIEHLTGVADLSCSFVVCDLLPMGKIPERTHFVKCPRTESEEYLAFILSLCTEHKIDIIMPGTGMDVRFFSENRDVFEKMGVQIAISSKQAIETSLNKEHCFSFLKSKGVSVPEYTLVRNLDEYLLGLTQLNFPHKKVCMKPAVYPDGSGKGFRIIDNSPDVYRRMFFDLPSQMYTVSSQSVIDAIKGHSNFPPMLLMEYLPGDEYSVYCFCNNGVAEYVVPNLKLDMVEMNTRAAVVRHNEEVIKLSQDIISHFAFEHNINIQIKYSVDGLPKVVEINPRVAGTILLPVNAGVDFLSFSVKKALGLDYPKQLPIRYGARIDRNLIDTFS